MEKKYLIELTFEELKLLDGKVSKEAQEVIDQAKREENIGFDLPVMNEILSKSMKTGKLTWVRKSIRSCSYCDKEYTYHRYKRNSKYHKKGDLNYDKPIYYSGIAFNEGFVTFAGIGDMCMECCEKHNVIKRLIDYIWQNDLKIQIQRNHYKPSKYIIDPYYICQNCKEEFPESTMGRDNAIFGGTYPSRCPHCDSKNVSQVSNKHTFINNPLALEEVIEIKNSIQDFNDELREEKYTCYQSNRNKNLFIIEQKSRNYFNLLRFDTEKRVYKIKELSVDEELKNKWVRILNEKGYIEDNE